MGVCASCLGLNRHPSHDQVDESAALLDDSHHVQYGGLADEDVAPPDEDEIRRAREALNRITNEATDNMIDVSHPSSTDLSQHYTHANHDRHTAGDHTSSRSSKLVEAMEDDEVAWLQSVRSAGLDSGTQIKGLQTGSLVLDIGQLRSSPAPQH
ncbi:hypothetical protein LTR91_000183 [Friedmanniomyces endolithicus]|uniref:Late endosomal/lysosomal adaptor and MAPK and MTOR activator-domain-containing protein n=1 Tax=Friedmanniomyces endolithicus TaxID=329885 RepID=A0AAN6J6D7_9PEZI|nr:hypothetical protein LTR35_007597 [Friedmanniomyces endolithicus]KAK0295184.1 hypothetical protein LTS00_006241 [Friedmanniomyces endolithicus]KAK0318566.1 hypothetical protein LTR82_010307 [Friedmanniomyces endolithicus]KAK0931235.1 hypothetical protein LTR57_000649 [Friedmanniomyces endolithicus]KAK1010384.1 hypothetical protein LTR54_005338 [Friedmanniomyces endolithicus]